MVNMWNEFGVHFLATNRIIDNLQWAEIGALGDRLSERKRGDVFETPGRAVIWVDPDKGITLGQNMFDHPNLFTVIECAPVSYAGMYKCSVSVKNRFGGISGTFSVMLNPADFIELSVDQIYVSFGNTYQEERYSYDVYALGKSFKLSKDKHPEWFHTKENLTYAMLTGETVIAGLPETVEQLYNIVLFAYTISRMDDKSILDRLAKLSYYRNKV